MRRSTLTSAERRKWRCADINELRVSQEVAKDFKYFLSNHDTSFVGSYQEQPSSAGRFNEQSREARELHKELQVCCKTQRFHFTVQ